MAKASFWTMERFPLIYEGGEVKAVLVDVASFAKMELIIDNLLNRETEPEDAVLTASEVLRKLILEARQTSPSPDWEQELDEL